MSTRERRPEERPASAAPGADEEPGGGRTELRAEASRLLEAADRAIDRALSGDSARFLLQNRQSGGQ